ncbi:MAG: Uma2 family endonuclease [Synechococcales bacterium]|nr:Uma2 family endonuclease [Synechococcales bacterium]
MTFTGSKFSSFEAYLTAEPSDLPEGRYEYWDGELREVMPESSLNDAIANYLYLLLVQAGIYYRLIRPHSCEVEVVGRPRTRFPDVTVLDDIHLTLMDSNTRVTRDMPPPRIAIEVVSVGAETSENYRRDYQEKVTQYAAIGIPEYWLIDPQREWVMVGTLGSETYNFQTFQGTEAIVSPTFPDLNLTAAQILQA